MTRIFWFLAITFFAGSACAESADQLISKLKFDHEMTDHQRAVAINTLSVLVRGQCSNILENLDDIDSISLSYTGDLDQKMLVRQGKSVHDPRYTEFGWTYFVTIGIQLNGDFGGKGYELAYYAAGGDGNEPGLEFHADEAVTSYACERPSAEVAGSIPYAHGSIPFVPIPELRQALEQ